jgi:hypothetical protein
MAESRPLVALHSPSALGETGLRMCLPEKSQDSDRIRHRGVRSLQSGFGEIIAKYGHFLRISEEEGPTFSAVQTAWRSKRDSNSQYLFEPLSAEVSVSCRIQNTAREFDVKNPTQKSANSPVSIRPPFAS